MSRTKFLVLDYYFCTKGHIFSETCGTVQLKGKDPSHHDHHQEDKKPNAKVYFVVKNKTKTKTKFNTVLSSALCQR